MAIASDISILPGTDDHHLRRHDIRCRRSGRRSTPFIQGRVSRTNLEGIEGLFTQPGRHIGRTRLPTTARGGVIYALEEIFDWPARIRGRARRHRNRRK